MIPGAGRAARRAALSVSDGRSRVPGGGPWSLCGAPGLRLPDHQGDDRDRRDEHRRVERQRDRVAEAPRELRGRPIASAASRSASSRVFRSSLPATAPATPSHTISTYAAWSQPEPYGTPSSSASQTPAPSVRSNPTPTRGTSGRTARSRSALSRRALPADREHPQRGHGDAAADEQEHAREVQEEGPVACHPPSNVAIAKRPMPRWKPVA